MWPIWKNTSELPQSALLPQSKPVDARPLVQELDRVLSQKGEQEVSADQASGSKGSGKARAVREGT